MTIKKKQVRKRGRKREEGYAGEGRGGGRDEGGWRNGVGDGSKSLSLLTSFS